MPDQPEQQMVGTSMGSETRADTRNEAFLSSLDVVVLLASKKRLLLASAVTGTALAVGILLSLPNMFTGTALVAPPQQQLPSTALLGQIGGLTSLTGIGLKNPSDVYIGILGSRTIADRLIEKFHLRQVYDAKNNYYARKKLASRTHFSTGKDTLVKIEVEDTDPARAAEIANAYVRELNERNSTLAVSDAEQRRAFLELRLRAEREALSSAENDMKQTQLRTGVFQLDGQAQLTVGSIAQTRAQITAGQVALERLRMGATPNNPEVLRTQAELDVLQAQLKKLEQGQHVAGDPLVATSALPQAGIEYIRAVRELKYHEVLFELLSKQYEAARIDESRAAPSLGVVDYALPPEHKSGPHRGLWTLAGAVLSVVVTSCIIILQRYAELPENAQKFRQLRVCLSKW